MTKELHTVTVMAVDGSRKSFKMDEWTLQQLDDTMTFTKNDNSVDITFLQANISWVTRQKDTSQEVE